MTSASEQKSSPVLKVGILYLSLTWLFIQLLWTATPIYDLPEILVRGVAFMLIMAFPIILMLAWVYGLIHGETKRTQRANQEDTQQANSGKIFKAVIIGLLSVSVIILLADIFVLNEKVETILNTESISEAIVFQSSKNER